MTPDGRHEQPRTERDGRSVFVAMRFGDPQSEGVWEIIEFVCGQIGLHAVRADAFRRPGTVLTDIREGIASAGIMLADLTGLNPNVLYEVGLAHANSNNVILLCQQGQPLPFDIAGQRVIFYSWMSPADKKRLNDELWQALQALRPPVVPSVIEGKIARSRSTIEDLQRLVELPAGKLAGECVWFSGFLSTLAISENEEFPPDEAEYRDALLRDKNLILALARKGCPIRLIISPPHPARVDDILAEGRETTIGRLTTLLALLNGGDQSSLARIEFAVSPFRQKHLYIIGHISVSEGFKTRLERGYQLTLRHDNPEAISASIAAQAILFDRLKRHTLDYYGSPGLTESHAELLKCTIKALNIGLETARSIEGPEPTNPSHP